MLVKAKVSFTYKDNILSMYAGEVADVDDTIGADLISEGYAKEYSEGGGSGGDNLSTANVTFVKNTSYPFVVELPIISGDYLYGYTTDAWITGDKTVVLYNNSCEGRINPETGVTLNITATGDIEVDSTAVIITGDGTITIS